MLTSATDKNLVLDSKFHCDSLHYLVKELLAEDTKILVNNSLTRNRMNAVCFMTTTNEKGGEKIPKSPTFSMEILKGGGYFNLN